MSPSPSSACPNVHSPVTDMAEYVKAIDRVEVVDPLTVRFHTKGPFPLAPEYLSAIGIVSRKHGEGASTSDYNTGKAAIGTGPYRFVSWARGDKIILARNETWWGGQAAMGQRDDPLYQESGLARGGVAGGDVDLIDKVSVQDIAQLKANPHVSPLRPGCRTTSLVSCSTCRTMRRRRSPAMTANRWRSIRSVIAACARRSTSRSIAMRSATG